MEIQPSIAKRLLRDRILIHANRFSEINVKETVESTAINYERLLRFGGHAKAYLSTDSMPIIVANEIKEVTIIISILLTQTPRQMITIKNYLLSALLVLLAFTFLACSSENEEDILPEPERCGDVTVSLSNNIIPIINQNCAISGCHVSGTGRLDLSVRGNIIQSANQIRNFTQSGFMPPQRSGKVLTDAQKETLYCWVENGALDN
jgi:hypothetical protein